MDFFCETLFIFISAPGRAWVWFCGLICGLKVETDVQFEDPKEPK